MCLCDRSTLILEMEPSMMVLLQWCLLRLSRVDSLTLTEGVHTLRGEHTLFIRLLGCTPS